RKLELRARDLEMSERTEVALAAQALGLRERILRPTELLTLEVDPGEVVPRVHGVGFAAGALVQLERFARVHERPLEVALVTAQRDEARVQGVERALVDHVLGDGRRPLGLEVGGGSVAHACERTREERVHLELERAIDDGPGAQSVGRVVKQPDRLARLASDAYAYARSYVARAADSTRSSARNSCSASVRGSIASRGRPSASCAKPSRRRARLRYAGSIARADRSPASAASGSPRASCDSASTRASSCCRSESPRGAMSCRTSTPK